MRSQGLIWDSKLHKQLSLPDGHACWMYSLCVRKGLLPYETTHSKIAKCAIVTICVVSLYMKSPHHNLNKFERAFKEAAEYALPMCGSDVCL